MIRSAPWETGLLVIAAVSYLLASVGYGAHLLLRTPGLALAARLAAWLAVAVQTVAIGVHCAATRQTPFTTPAETLSAVAWAVALAYLTLELVVKPRPTALGAFALPAAFLCLFGGAVLQRNAALRVRHVSEARLLDSNVISLHVLALLFAFGLLTLAFGCAVLYQTQHRMLKHKRVLGGLFGKLPPLARLEQIAFALVAFAFPLLTVGLIAGILRASGGGMGGGWATDPKSIASFVSWAVYGAYLTLHVAGHWRGPRANYFLLGGLLVMLATLFAPTTHRFD